MGKLRVAVGLGAVLLAGTGILAVAEAKVVRGTDGNDRLEGTRRADDISGRRGDDRLFGKHGRDFLVGGSGEDKLVGGSAFDELRGGANADVIDARDGSPDLIDCGPGFDRAIVGFVEDGIFDCERVDTP